MFSGLSLWERLQTRVWSGLAAAWIFSVGACVGSFLNVVVYRAPRGRSLVRRGSYCPYCTTPIQPRDNIPILGWLLLGGRCRTCRLPISPRYPLVEATTALLFLGLFLVELTSGGANLPLRDPAFRSGAVDVLLDPQWDLIGLCAFHLFLLCNLLCWALIAYDGHRVPATCLGFALLVSGTCSAVWPHLHPVPAVISWPEAWTESQWLIRLQTDLAGVLAGLAGLAAGTVIGLLIDLAAWGCPPVRFRPQAASGLALAGLTLGWQAALAVALLAGALTCLQAIASRTSRSVATWPWLAWLTLACTMQLAVWRWLSPWPAWPGPKSSAALLALAAAAALLANGVGVRLVLATMVSPPGNRP
ncbi:MAG: prepilin peptidase [Pirellulaceae bacterium]|nr:prepilin peptidase [Pirellulaceae bacterium]